MSDLDLDHIMVPLKLTASEAATLSYYLERFASSFAMEMNQAIGQGNKTDADLAVKSIWDVNRISVKLDKELDNAGTREGKRIFREDWFGGDGQSTGPRGVGGTKYKLRRVKSDGEEGGATTPGGDAGAVHDGDGQERPPGGENG